jgi:hypothetical protein
MIENTEVDAAGSVPELIAFNPLDTPVLLQRALRLPGSARMSGSPASASSRLVSSSSMSSFSSRRSRATARRNERGSRGRAGAAERRSSMAIMDGDFRCGLRHRSLGSRPERASIGSGRAL